MSESGTCPSCSGSIEPEWRACPSCGETLSPAATCAACSKPLEPEWKACPYCGKAVGDGPLNDVSKLFGTPPLYEVIASDIVARAEARLHAHRTALYQRLAIFAGIVFVIISGLFTFHFDTAVDLAVSTKFTEEFNKTFDAKEKEFEADRLYISFSNAVNALEGESFSPPERDIIMSHLRKISKMESVRNRTEFLDGFTTIVEAFSQAGQSEQLREIDELYSDEILESQISIVSLQALIQTFSVI